MKKLDIVIESSQRENVIDIIKECGATGYTIYDVNGEGMRESRDDISFNHMTKNVGVFVIGPEAVIMEIVKRIYELLPNCAGIVCVSDVEVLRKGHFSLRVIKRAIKRFRGIEA
jgi:nitrogen regulatory protein PII